jgi:hypothetical protein
MSDSGGGRNPASMVRASEGTVKKLLVRLFLLIVITVAGFILLAWWTAPTDITSDENLDKLTGAMTEAEVVAVLGTPGRDGPSDPNLEPFPPKFTGKAWRTRNGMELVVTFDRDGRVTRMIMGRGSESWMDKIRRWLRLSP